jgi:hypothetical protein
MSSFATIALCIYVLQKIDVSKCIFGILRIYAIIILIVLSILACCNFAWVNCVWLRLYVWSRHFHAAYLLLYLWKLAHFRPIMRRSTVTMRVTMLVC